MSKRIGIIILIGFVALVHASCDKSNGSVSTQEEKALIDFAAESRDAAVKGSDLSEFHEDFGVWGIARHSIHNDYLLWESTAMTKVERQGTTNAYAPVKDAFWLGGYTYNFIAVAPWEAADDISSITYGTGSGTASLAFPFDLAGKYDGGDYDFDLMAAVAETPAKTYAKDYGQQPLAFWHLFSKIRITVSFLNATGTVTGLRLLNVDTNGTYSISFDTDKSLKVGYELPSSPSEEDITFDRTNLDEGQNSQWTLHLLPQYIDDFELYLDFDITEGDYTVTTSNFKVNLEPAQSASPYYDRNEWYNWNIIISPKTITFDVSVNDWGIPENDYPDEFPIE